MFSNTACWAKIQTFSISFYPTHTTSFLRYKPFPISFWTPVLANPDKAPTPKSGKTVPVRNEINPANAGKNPASIFMLWANCVFYILIVMPFFSSYASTSLSSCDLVKAITSSPYRSENLKRIMIQIRFKYFLELVFLTLWYSHFKIGVSFHFLNSRYFKSLSDEIALTNSLLVS